MHLTFQLEIGRPGVLELFSFATGCRVYVGSSWILRPTWILKFSFDIWSRIGFFAV